MIQYLAGRWSYKCEVIERHVDRKRRGSYSKSAREADSSHAMPADALRRYVISVTGILRR